MAFKFNILSKIFWKVYCIFLVQKVLPGLTHLPLLHSKPLQHRGPIRLQTCPSFWQRRTVKKSIRWNSSKNSQFLMSICFNYGYTLFQSQEMSVYKIYLSYIVRVHISYLLDNQNSFYISVGQNPLQLK